MSLLAQIRQDAAAVATASEEKLRERLAANSAGCPSVVVDPAAGRREAPPIAVGPSAATLVTLADLERVEITGEWTLPDVGWLPPFFRGLPVVQVLGPVPFHGERGPGGSGSSAGSLAASSASTSTGSATPCQPTAPTPPPAPATICGPCALNETSELGGLLFWEQAGPARIVRCVECFPPPMRKLVADLWLIDWDPANERERWACASSKKGFVDRTFQHLAAAEAKQRAASAANVKRDNEGF